jgi:dihydrofolate reductase
MLITEVDANPEGDAFFPEFSSLEWKKEESEQFSKDENNEFNFEFIIYKRIKS